MSEQEAQAAQTPAPEATQAPEGQAPQEGETSHTILHINMCARNGRSTPPFRDGRSACVQRNAEFVLQ